MIRAICLSALIAVPAAAQEVGDLEAREGWSVLRTDLGFPVLVEAVREAASAGGLAVVTMAGPTDAAAARGVDIPGNRVIGLFNNDYAVRILRLSTAAMIEAPIRVYVTENGDGTASLGYILPSVVLAPYIEGTPDLAEIAVELDAAFAHVAETATN